MDTSLPPELPISDTELCAILSNGLENALQAVLELEKPERWVELYAGIRQNNLLIEIKNPCKGEVRIQNGLPVSRRVGHGFGCQSIRAIAEQNRGICMFEVEKGVFALRVALPVKDGEAG